MVLIDGQILPINQNQSLYSLLGTTYGGDGRTSFALPDMRSRTPAGDDAQLPQGAKPGVEYVTLTAAEMPAHSHTVKATTADGTTKNFGGGVLATAFDKKSSTQTNMYAPATSLVALARSAGTLISADLPVWPLNMTGWHCAPKWCGAWATCRGRFAGPDPWNQL